MATWLIRAGRNGEQESVAIENSVAVIGWREMPDFKQVHTKDEMLELCRKCYPDTSEKALINYNSQVWAFYSRIKDGDLVILPLKTQSVIAIGRVAGAYEYRTDLGAGNHHTRPVEWIRTDIPRTAFEQDLLYSLGAFMTVCRVQRNNAEERIKAILENRQIHRKPQGDEGGDETEQLDVEQFGKDQILAYIQQKFAGHGLARLVEGVLRAEGYLTKLSPSGPDGGVDILAGGGALGFSDPRLCVQVKSSQSPEEVTVLRSLIGTMQTLKADQGLLVCWGGFKQSVLNEAKQSFFSVRLWDSADLINAVLKSYEKLPKDLQAELPLKNIWCLVLEEG
jgi:restriction system protein